MTLHVQSWLLLSRGRLLGAFAASVFFTLFVHMAVSADGPTDLGIFWHHFCGCPVDPDDVRILLNFPITFGFVGLVLGIMPIKPLAQQGSPASVSDTLFLLTRPIPRSTALFAPLAVATVAIAVLPTLAIALLLGWLRLVHAPSLGYLLATIEQIPAVRSLGPHPSFPALLSAIQFPRRYAAAIALGLCSYTILASQRWLILSPNKHLKFLGIFPAVILFFPVARLFSGHLINFLLMTPGRAAPLGYAPSTPTIALHYAFAAAVIFGSWRLLRTIEL
jgi:hypothetical protein